LCSDPVNPENPVLSKIPLKVPACTMNPTNETNIHRISIGVNANAFDRIYRIRRIDRIKNAK
jgi:hypothetical protein